MATNRSKSRDREHYREADSEFGRMIGIGKWEIFRRCGDVGNPGSFPSLGSPRIHSGMSWTSFVGYLYDGHPIRIALRDEGRDSSTLNNYINLEAVFNWSASID